MKSLYKFALAFSFFAATGIASAADMPATSDADTTAAVKAAFAAEPSLKDQKIEVATKSNDKGEKEVFLTGTVTEGQMMVTATKVAEKISGVKFVINDIYPEAYLRQQKAQKQ